jgi:hypothetical protein
VARIGSLLCFLVAGANAQMVVPNADLSPADVVRIQLDALRLNDAADRGIALAYRFASPENRRTTGPLERFALMLQTGPYAAMLQARSFAIERAEVRGNVARVSVVVITPSRVVGYTFYLSRDYRATCSGCWLTDSVLVKTVNDKVTNWMHHWRKAAA